MKRRLSFSALPFFILFFAGSVFAQSKQFWPEVDTYWKINSNIRFFFLASVTKEDGVGTSAEVGPNIDFFMKPLVKLKSFAGLQLDTSKSRPLTLRIGYRYLPAFDGPNEQRIVVEGTGRFPTKVGVFFSDRNRVDLRFIENEDFSWRYRNRLSVERNFDLRAFHMTPYARIELYYDSRYSKWSNTAVSVGCIFPVGKKMELEPYYEHQNNTGQSPNQKVDAIGLVLSIYFRQ